MKLVDIIYGVIVEQARDDKDIEDREIIDISKFKGRRLKQDIDRDREDIEDREREDREREREDREREGREREDWERELEDREREDREREREDREREENDRLGRVGSWVCKDPITFPGCQQIRANRQLEKAREYRLEFFPSQRECIESSPCSGERRPREIVQQRPQPVSSTERPVTPQTTDSQTTTQQSTTPTTPQQTSQQQTSQTPEMSVNTKYNSDGEIKNVKKIQSKKYIEKVKINLKKQLDVQTPQVKQKFRQYNIQPDNVSYLVPLSIDTGTLLSIMELDGLNLPLMMILYKNSDKLYQAMRENKPFKPNETKPVGGPIEYKNFWNWSKEVYEGWGPWMKTNVVSNFPDMSKNTFPSLAF